MNGNELDPDPSPPVTTAGVVDDVEPSGPSVLLLDGTDVDVSPEISVVVEPNGPIVVDVEVDDSVLELVDGTDVEVSPEISVVVEPNGPIVVDVVVDVLVVVLVDVLVDVEVGASVVVDVLVGASVVDVDVDVLVDGIDVLVDVDVDTLVEVDVLVELVEVDVPPVQSWFRSTTVARFATTPSGHDPVSVRMTQLVTEPGTIVVACVVPEGGTGDVYPVTAAGVFAGPTVAVALVIVIGRDGSVSLLRIVQVTTWSPFVQVVAPESTGMCAHAGSANRTTDIAAAAARTTTNRVRPLESRSENRSRPNAISPPRECIVPTGFSCYWQSRRQAMTKDASRASC